MQQIAPTSSSKNILACSFCYQSLPSKIASKCARCATAIYCGRECQKSDWQKHKLVCKKPENRQPVEQKSSLLMKAVSENNPTIRKRLCPSTKDLQKQIHLKNTHEFILEGSKILDPKSSVVVICGAQFYQKKIVEPLPELLKQCKKMILIDIDPATLQELKKLLNNDPKVICHPMDLTGIAPEKIENVLNDLKPLKDLELCLGKIRIFFAERWSEIRTRKPLALPSLEKEDRVDYTISSLVATELSMHIKKIVLDPILEKFKPSMENQKEANALTQVSLSLSAFILHLMHTHVKDLIEWTSPNGNIYFADTFSVTHEGLDFIELVSEEGKELMIDLLKENRTVQERNWKWTISPVQSFDVKATLALAKKEKNPSENSGQA